MHPAIDLYNESQVGEPRTICTRLAELIDAGLEGAESKVWHSHPVWFFDKNPIVGYSVMKDSVRILFWSGQSFGDVGLVPEGSFKAAEARFTSADQINEELLAQWLDLAEKIQWDYKNIIKRKGVLERLK